MFPGGRTSNPTLSRTGGSAAGVMPGFQDPLAGNAYTPYAPANPATTVHPSATTNPYASSGRTANTSSGSDWGDYLQNPTVYTTPATVAPPPPPVNVPSYTTPGGANNTPVTSSSPAGASTPATTSGAPVYPSSPYGPNPYMSNPTVTGPNGSSGLNPNWYATPESADQVAKLLGGTVISTNGGLNGEFQANQPQYMIQMPDGRLINPGMDVIDLYNHGYSQSYIDYALNQLKTGQYADRLTSMGGLDPSVAKYFSITPGSVPGTGTVKASGYGTPAGQSYNPGAYIPPDQAQANQAASNPLAGLMGMLSGNNTNPFLGLVSQLYGSNPFTAALGPQLGGLLSGMSNGNNMSSIAQLLNALYSQRTQPGSGVLSPLFWGSQSQTGYQPNFGLGNYFPSYY